MARLRFATDRALFETFPSASADVKTAPTGAEPLVFLRELTMRGKLQDAVSFCAYLLPRREAVAWACRSVAMEEAFDQAASPALAAARAWVEAPAEDTRLAAHARWTEGDREDPATWIALAAAWSGGRLVPDQPASPPAPSHLTATAVRVALLLMLHRLEPDKAPQRVRAWIAEGVRLAEAGL